MLVLSRKPGQRILIGDNITITLVRIGANNVRLGIEAPREIKIVRPDAHEQKEKPIRAAAGS